MEGDKDGPRPIVTFFQPQPSQEPVLFSLLTGNEAALRRFLPKSHVANVIIRDNTSVQRVQEIKLRLLDSSKKKVSNYFEHMKKTFWHDQQNKMNRWKGQYSRYERMLEKIDQRAKQQFMSSAMLMLIAQKSTTQIQKSILKKN